MAKSLRSKVKRSFRNKKRETGVYAAASAARLNRLNAKLIEVTKKAPIGAIQVGAEEENTEDIPAQEPVDSEENAPDAMAIDAEQPKKVSTHGPRNSRREAWRESKGLPSRVTSTGLNRQGVPAAKRKAGRSKRRR
ncbi:hypothetical protein HYPSUDRAFT_76348 [Hypholoma sublateritium FD-334 SS-4]|uniref:DUF2423 domain-containing protein n=1 Tax=Hypholoma sublateritium (strain FD-334 SS-4) TaxID=945553 RepID=A0A0D2ML31_HYPSF|nr:hypothetical protein HYPSUDRAFT_76348 [Hypholoma sublateritium FD-334 SS-4]